MQSPDVEVQAALSRCGGVATRQRLRAMGVTAHNLWLGTSQRRVERVRRGVYILPGAEPDLVAAVRLGGVLSCTSAARAHGLPVLTDDQLHLTVPRHWAHAGLQGASVHRRDLVDADHDGVCTGLLRTAVDCARELALPDAVVVLDAALRSGLSVDGLLVAARAAAGPGATALRRAAAMADGRAESPLESCLRLLVAPLAHLEPQVVIEGVGRVDLVLDEWLVLEADGFEFHSTRASYRSDRLRANALAVQGFTLLRFTYEDVMFRPDYVLATVRELLRRSPLLDRSPATHRSVDGAAVRIG